VTCIDGTAWDTCFNYYTVDYKPIGGLYQPVDPAHPFYSWTVITDPVATWNTATVPDGQYTVRLQGYDDCAHVAGAEHTVTVDNTKPTALISFPAECSYIADSVVEIHGSAFDANLANWTLSYAGGDAHAWTVIATGTTSVPNGLLAEWDTSELTPCAYTLRLLVTDASQLNCNNAISNQSEYLTSVILGCGGDINFDGVINQSDLGILLSQFGESCP
jgi:hypothetical protein